MKVSPGRSRLTKYSSTSPSTGRSRRLPDQPHLQQRRLDDGADVHAVLPRDALAAHMHAALAVAEQLAPALVGRQRVAAVLDEAQHVVEILARQRRIGRGAPHLGEDVIGVERRGAGQPSRCCASTSSPPGRGGSPSSSRAATPSDRRLAFQHLEAVGRHQDGAARLVHPVVGAADALQQPRDALRRADLDHLIDPAPVDAEIERRGRHHGAQLAAPPSPPRPCGAARPPGCRDAARSAASASFSRHSAWNISSAWARVLTNTMVMPASRMRAITSGAASRPIWPDQDSSPSGSIIGELGRRAVRHLDHPSRRRHRRGSRAGCATVADSPTRRQRRRQRRQPRDAERQLVAALGAGQRMHLVHHHAGEAGEHRRRIRQRQQHRQAFRRGQQDVRRVRPAGARGGWPACRRCGSRSRRRAASRRPARVRLRAMSVASAFSGLT